MARVKAPLFSLDARGRLGRAIYFMKSGGQHSARELESPSGDPSGAQLEQRLAYHDGSALWRATHWLGDDLIAWRLDAAEHARTWTAYNAFMSNFLKAATASQVYTQPTNVRQSVQNAGNQIIRMAKNGQPNNRWAVSFLDLVTYRVTNNVAGSSAGTNWDYGNSGQPVGRPFRAYVYERAYGVTARRSGYFEYITP